jgi:hypothetical protein
MNNEPANTAVFADQAFWDGWPSVRFLLNPDRPVNFYDRQSSNRPAIVYPAGLYAWPYEKLDQITGGITPPARVEGRPGSLAQGDLEPEPYPLFSYYSVNEWLDWPAVARFDNTIVLHQAIVTIRDQVQLQVDLTWSTDQYLDRSLIAFVHVVGPTGLIGQSDSVPSQGHWPVSWWRPGLMIRDVHQIDLAEAFQAGQHQVLVGLYDAGTRLRLQASDRSGVTIGDSWLLEP